MEKSVGYYDTPKLQLLCFLCFCSIVCTSCETIFTAASNKITGYSSPSPSIVISDDLDLSRRIILEEAITFMGTPYCYGGSTPFCTDCSGFIQQVFGNIGFKLPRTAHEQYLEYHKEDCIPEPGDLLFFRYTNEGRISHVGLYAGENIMIHASEKKGVITSTLEHMQAFIVGYGKVPIQEFSSK